MERKSSPRVLFPQNPALPWITDYQQACLTTYTPGTVEVYSSILRHFTRWITEQTRKRTTFHPDQLTPATIEQYLSDLCAQC